MLVLKNADFDGNIELVGSFIDLLHMQKKEAWFLSFTYRSTSNQSPDSLHFDWKLLDLYI
jgi:hypothetical protein